jgi:transposase-like protein
MLKDSEPPIFPSRRSHRTYTAAFKAEIVAACQQPGVSIASLAGRHGMNVNVVHRWLKEHERNGWHQLADGTSSSEAVTTQVGAFVSLQLSPPMTEPMPADQSIKVELHKGALNMVVTWPLSAGNDFAIWTATVFK